MHAEWSSPHAHTITEKWYSGPYTANGVFRSACPTRASSVEVAHPCTVPELPIRGFAPRADPPDVALDDASAGLLDEDASLELVLEGRCDRDADQRSDLVLSARHAIDGLQALEPVSIRVSTPKARTQKNATASCSEKTNVMQG
eukprot:245491-Rhodomonas_salina.2